MRGEGAPLLGSRLLPRSKRFFRRDRKALGALVVLSPSLSFANSPRSLANNFRIDTARTALVVAARREGIRFAENAIEEIASQTQGYPYFLQVEIDSWNITESSPIRPADARRATKLALAELDAGFFRIRFDRLTPTEKRYLRTMAELGSGPHRSGDIAERL
jgi:hypothetical protein